MAYKINPESKEIEQDTGFGGRFEPSGFRVTDDGTIESTDPFASGVVMEKGHLARSDGFLHAGLKIEPDGSVRDTGPFGGDTGYRINGDLELKDDRWPLDVEKILGLRESDWNPSPDQIGEIVQSPTASEPAPREIERPAVIHCHPGESTSYSKPVEYSSKKVVAKSPERQRRDPPLPDPGIAGWILAGAVVLLFCAIDAQSDKRREMEKEREKELENLRRAAILRAKEREKKELRQSKKMPTNKNDQKNSSIPLILIGLFGFALVIIAIVFTVLFSLGFDASVLFH